MPLIVPLSRPAAPVTVAASATSAGAGALFLLPLALVLLPSVATAQSAIAPIWSGIYVGATAGGNWSDFETSYAKRSFDLDGYTLGVHGGVNMQFLGFVLGVEADATIADASHSSGLSPAVSASSEVDWLGSVRGRLGYALGPLHIYGTAGLAWTETTVVGHTLGSTFGHSTETQRGFVYGAGVEARLIPNLSFRAEVLRYDFDMEWHTLTGSTGGSAVSQLIAVEPDFTVFRAGMSFHLN